MAEHLIPGSEWLCLGFGDWIEQGGFTSTLIQLLSPSSDWQQMAPFASVKTGMFIKTISVTNCLIAKYKVSPTNSGY